jgi:hypothetical protein
MLQRGPSVFFTKRVVFLGKKKITLPSYFLSILNNLRQPLYSSFIIYRSSFNNYVRTTTRI